MRGVFGNVTTTGETTDNPFEYTGRENDGTGLLYYRARYYSPEMQRFISEDPIRLRGGINFYNYVQNNPVNRVDPFGLEWRDGSFHYSESDLQVLKEKAGETGHSMAEVAEISDAIKRALLLWDLDGLKELKDKIFPKKPCKEKITEFDKEILGLKF